MSSAENLGPEAVPRDNISPHRTAGSYTIPSSSTSAAAWLHPPRRARTTISRRAERYQLPDSDPADAGIELQPYGTNLPRSRVPNDHLHGSLEQQRRGGRWTS
jgi:hypothetical protein